MNRLSLPYDYERPAYQSLQAYRFFNINDQEILVQFVRDQLNIHKVYVDFSLKHSDDEYAVTNHGDMFKVVSTVIHILADYLENNDFVKLVAFTAVEDTTPHDENRRLLLFQRTLNHFDALSNWKYEQNGNTIEMHR